MTSILLRQCAAESLGSFVVCFAGILALKQNPDLLGASLAQGLAYAVMMTALVGISGAHFNPAISGALFVAGKLTGKQFLAYISSQLAGALAAGLLLANMFSDSGKLMVSAGTPDFGPGVTTWQGLAIETVLTFVVVAVYFGTMMGGRESRMGGLAVGLAVTAGMLAGGPISGAAMNPARVFGPALASGHWAHHPVFWIAGLVAAVAAGLIFGRWLMRSKA